MGLGRRDELFGVRHYVEGGITVETLWWSDDRQCLAATRSLISNRVRLLDGRGPNDPPLLSVSKISDWNMCLEVLGFDVVVDHEQMTGGRPQIKVDKVARVLEAWPDLRRTASVQRICP